MCSGILLIASSLPQVWGINFKSKMKRTIFGGLAFAGTCFFLYLYK
jgi:hypothetical protein